MLGLWLWSTNQSGTEEGHGIMPPWLTLTLSPLEVTVILIVDEAEVSLKGSKAHAPALLSIISFSRNLTNFSEKITNACNHAAQKSGKIWAYFLVILLHFMNIPKKLIRSHPQYVQSWNLFYPSSPISRCVLSSHNKTFRRDFRILPGNRIIKNSWQQRLQLRA